MEGGVQAQDDWTRASFLLVSSCLPVHLVHIIDIDQTRLDADAI